MPDPAGEPDPAHHSARLHRGWLERGVLSRAREPGVYAYEILTAFFLEAVFIGIMLFGASRVPNWLHTLATFLVAFGTTMSAFWILVLNSWMHTPVGFELRDGVVHAADWSAIIFNPSMPYRLVHMLLASGLTADGILSPSASDPGRNRHRLANGPEWRFTAVRSILENRDRLLAVIGEELGFTGVTLIILLFTFIVWRAMRIGAMAESGESRFAVYTAYGCALWIGFQSFVNIGVNLGMMPTKGLTLPFMSYGGNSIIVGMLAIAMLQRIHLEYAPGKPREGAIWRTSS